MKKPKVRVSKYLFLCLLFLSLGQILVWFQVYSHLKWDWAKNNLWIFYISSIPITFFFIKSTFYGFYAFQETLWPVKFLSFAIGTLIFGILTFFFFGEVLTWKTVASLILTIGIIAL